jgi:hypothetical protein
MEQAGLHPMLEIRLTALAERISLLRQKAGEMDTPEHFEEFADIEELDRLNVQGAGFSQDVKAGFEAVADDLKGLVQDHIMWIDSGFRPDRRPKPPSEGDA